MRPPSVFVRALAPHEGQRLKRLSKQSRLASTRQRAMILLASNTLMSVPEIARMLLTDESVPTPTYASYLNRIESTLGAIDEFVCKNADYSTGTPSATRSPSTSATTTAPSSAHAERSKPPNATNAEPPERPSSSSPPER